MSDVVPQEYSLNVEKRSKLKNHKPLVIWFTGLSGSGKSTLANVLEEELHKKKIHTYSLDGDNIRGGINKDLGFTQEDRTENTRRIAEVARLFADSGTVALAAFITPLEKDRQIIREIIGKEHLVEVFVSTSLEECERRDVKGFYKKARAGEIENFTGINAPYEEPKDADIDIDTEEISTEEGVERILAFIEPKLRIHTNE